MVAPAVFAFGLVAFGFLGMGPVTIAVDSYGPVTDNAQSVYELSTIETIPDISKDIEKEFGFTPDFENAKVYLEENDGAGNTFKATAKPVLIGTAVVGATTMVFGIIMLLQGMYEAQVAEIAKKYLNARDFLYLGRGINYPIALEGALKLKEISYIHAEGYPAGEMKHGPIALIDREMPVIVIAPHDPWYEKMFSQIEQARSRGGPVVAVATEGDGVIPTHATHVLWVPETPWMLSPVTTVIPLQLLAYHIAVLRGCDVDKPRNLAKSVTVE